LPTSSPKKGEAVAQATPPASSASAPPSPSDAALASYRSGNYDDATRAWDALAPGDPEAALWAAKSVRDGSGCAQAIPRFDAVATRSFGTKVGYDAVLEGGKCLQLVGSTELARAHFARLLTVPAYASRAQAAIDSLPGSAQAQQIAAAPVAARKAAPSKKPAATTPAQQQAPPAQTPSQKATSY
jgi:hypothetical protein